MFIVSKGFSKSFKVSLTDAKRDDSISKCKCWPKCMSGSIVELGRRGNFLGGSSQWWNFGTLEGKGERSLPPLLIDDNFPVGQQIGFLNDVSKKAEIVCRRRHNQQIVINMIKLIMFLLPKWTLVNQQFCYFQKCCIVLNVFRQIFGLEDDK